MAMNGYPAGGNCNIDQTTIWNYIQANDQEPKAWYSDPYAVTKTLNDKCPPPNNGEWVDTSGTDQEKVLYTLLFWMAKFQFPSLVCLFGHDYWNVITYYETTDDPRVVFDPMLQKIGFYSPGNPT